MLIITIIKNETVTFILKKKKKKSNTYPFATSWNARWQDSYEVC